MPVDFLGFLKNSEEIVLEKKYYESPKDIDKMILIQKQVIESTNNTIRIDASECTNISPTCMILLSSVALIRNEQKKDIKIMYKRDTKFHKFLESKGFINAEKQVKNIPISIINNDDDIINAIKMLIDRSPLKDLDLDKQIALISELYEIPNNSLAHSKSTAGTLYCGYYKNNKCFYFCIYDIGIGIPKSVREYLKDDNLSARKALEWALEKGNSTKDSEFPRGIGFTRLEEFRKSCNGTITIITEDVYYHSQKNNCIIKKLNNKVPGTLFTFKIVI